VLISHSQQCMLHGDCYHRNGNSMEVYKQSFENHLAAGSIFGYCDHPFSREYSYGWTDESERIQAHQELLDFMFARGNLWKCSIGECLDFLAMRGSARVFVANHKLRVEYDKIEGMPRLAIRWKGSSFEA